MSDQIMITLTIDARTVRVPRGTSILTAAKSVGIDIPYYCYHPGLSVVGNCRMCLVEIEKNPKLQPSCATPVAEGMVVRTQTPETLRNRQAVLEFLLLNHPLDCPVCDQAGECELQNYYMDHGAYAPRFNENKTKRKKAFPIGPYVMLDQERCILCTRCVRFTREITRTAELSVHERGHLSAIDIFPGAELANRYSGNVVDICPVGALTDRDFRFQCRAWFLGRSSSICPGCSRGCNIEIHYNQRYNPRYHDRRVHRLKPRFNEEVNGHWMCDEGRYAYHRIDAPDRLKTPRLKVGGAWQETSWEEAIRAAAHALSETVRIHGPNAVAVLASPQMTNEDLFRLRQLFRDAQGVSRIEYRVPPLQKPFADDLLLTSDRNPNSRGAEVLGLAGPGACEILQACANGEVRYLYLCYHDLSTGFDRAAVEAALSRVEHVVFQGPFGHATSELASIQLPAAVYAEKEGTFTNLQGRVQRIDAAVPPLGESISDLEILGRLATELGVPVPPVPAREVLKEMGASVEAFAGMTYESIGDSGRNLP